MILTKYIFKEMFKNQLIILVILFLVCFFQKLIRVYGLENNISPYLVFLCLILYIPELSKLIMPFSLFLSIIITCYRLHIHNEILAMYVCTVKKSFLIQIILLYSFIVLCIAFINMSWISFYCEKYKNKILFKIENSMYPNKLIEKKIQLFFDNKLVLFVDTIDNEILKNIFLFKKYDKTNTVFSIITSAQSSVDYKDNCIQSIILDTGNYYEIDFNQATFSNIYVTEFSQHQLIIDYNFNFLDKVCTNINSMSINQLWNAITIESQIEFDWRLNLLISILIMPLIASLLMISITEHYVFRFILAIVLYIFFFLSHITLRFYAILDYENSFIYMWLINLIYFIIVILVGLWDRFRFNKFFRKFCMLLTI